MSTIRPSVPTDNTPFATLRASWNRERAGGHFRSFGPDENPGPVLRANEYDECEVVATRAQGEVLATAFGAFYLIRNDEDPRGVEVRLQLRQFAREAPEPNV